MNTNQVKGKTKEFLGEFQKHAGRIIGSKLHEAKGHAKQIEGKNQKKAGDRQEATKELSRKSSTRNTN